MWEELGVDGIERKDMEEKVCVNCKHVKPFLYFGVPIWYKCGARAELNHVDGSKFYPACEEFNAKGKCKLYEQGELK